MRKTIISVAKELNLAPSTVSKVINHKGNVSKATRERVLKYVKEVGYIQDASARTLKSKRSYTLGILFFRYLTGWSRTSILFKRIASV